MAREDDEIAATTGSTFQARRRRTLRRLAQQPPFSWLRESASLSVAISLTPTLPPMAWTSLEREVDATSMKVRRALKDGAMTPEQAQIEIPEDLRDVPDLDAIVRAFAADSYEREAAWQGIIATGIVSAIGGLIVGVLVGALV